ncbi:MAG: 5-bromo-4-chloroindolyl phosphate hydrolysis protein [Cocleimonas sp.]|jgi:5-bromo-4-chloroindolyl phosphate hydrolysis protein
MSKATRYDPENKIINTVRAGFKGLLLFVMPMPVLFAAVVHLLKGNITLSIISGLLFAGFMIAAIVARHGFKLESKFKQRKFSKAPGMPFKSVAAIILASTTGLTAFLLTNYGLIESVLFGGVTLIAFYIAYGVDPRQDKSGDISLGVSAEEVYDALEEAELKIASIEASRKSILNIEFNRHLKLIVTKARGILTLIEEDPKDLSRARKFLKVYLDGTARVTESYANTQNKSASTAALDQNFSEVLESIETTFDEQHRKLLENDQFDLDVKIEVLKAQLKGI